MSRIRIALFRDVAAAERVRQSLDHAGIPAELHDELGLAKLWFVTKGEAGVRLEVPAAHFDRALQFLREGDAYLDLLRSAVCCPECRSLRVEYPQVTQKSLFTNLVMGLAAELRFLEREYYCEDCHCMWVKPGQKPRRTRAHMAPGYFLEGTDTASAPGQACTPAQSKRRQRPL